MDYIDNEYISEVDAADRAMLVKYTRGQAMSFYHSQILRIPHGNQNPTKRYLSDNAILALFYGWVHIQEKVDDKMASFAPRLSEERYGEEGHKHVLFDIYGDMTGKHTCHEHLKYRELPSNKKIPLDTVIMNDDKFSVMYQNTAPHRLDYCIVDGRNLTIEQIYDLLEILSTMPSHFGCEHIEGLVIKNYSTNTCDFRAGKWINESFEDHLKGK